MRRLISVAENRLQERATTRSTHAHDRPNAGRRRKARPKKGDAVQKARRPRVPVVRVQPLYESPFVEGRVPGPENRSRTLDSRRSGRRNGRERQNACRPCRERGRHRLTRQRCPRKDSSQTVNPKAQRLGKDARGRSWHAVGVVFLKNDVGVESARVSRRPQSDTASVSDEPDSRASQLGHGIDLGRELVQSFAIRWFHLRSCDWMVRLAGQSIQAFRRGSPRAEYLAGHPRFRGNGLCGWSRASAPSEEHLR